MNTKIVIVFLLVLMSQVSFSQEKNIVLDKPFIETAEVKVFTVSNMVDGKISRTFVAGELVFTNQKQVHIPDVIDMVKKCARKGITFVLVRKTSQFSDHKDKRREVIIN